MRNPLIALTLILSACVPATSPDQPIGFVVLRCNQPVEGGRFGTVLNVRFADAAFQYAVGEDGLTRQIAFDGASAVAFIRAQQPERTAGKEGLYNDNCGRRRESTTDDGD